MDFPNPARRLEVTQLFQEFQRYRTVAGRIEGTLQGPEAGIRTWKDAEVTIVSLTKGLPGEIDIYIYDI